MISFYRRFLALGEGNYADDSDRRRAQILNFLIFWALLTIVPFVVILNFPKEDPLEFYAIIATLTATLLGLYLNIKGFNQQAVFLIIIVQMSMIWLLIIKVPTQTGAPYANMLAGMVSVLLIKKRNFRILFLIVTVISFIFSNYIQLKYKPFNDLEYAAVVLILFLLFIGVVYYDSLMLSYQKKIKEQGADLVKLEEERHRKEMELKQKDLEMMLASATVKDQLTENLTKKLKEVIQSDDVKKEIQKVIRDLNSQSEWINKQALISENIDDLNADFYNRLLGRFPDLTRSERELCVFLKLNLSNKEIAAIKNSTENSINVSKTRLRKRLGLKTNKELFSFLIDF